MTSPGSPDHGGVGAEQIEHAKDLMMPVSELCGECHKRELGEFESERGGYPEEAAHTWKESETTVAVKITRSRGREEGVRTMYHFPTINKFLAWYIL